MNILICQHKHLTTQSGASQTITFKDINYCRVRIFSKIHSAVTSLLCQYVTLPAKQLCLYVKVCCITVLAERSYYHLTHT